MRAVILAAVVALVSVETAAAAPAADAILYWAPPDAPAVLRTRTRTAAEAKGAAFVDRSPPAPQPADATRIAAAITAYDELRFDEALALLDQAAAELDRTGAAGLDVARLAELFLYRGLARIQLGDQARAWDDLLIAARIDPSRVLDPARFPPRAIEQLTRARAEVSAAPRGVLRVDAPEGCVISIDGAITGDGRAELPHGAHWIDATCREHQPWGRRVVLDRTAVEVVVAATPITPPTEDEALIQARALGAATVVEVTILAGAARVRHRSADGRERARALVTADGDVIAATVERMLTPAVVVHEPWYRKRWVWAAGGALAAAAVLVPVALRDTGPGDRVIRPTGLPPW
ncbi:MAG TPA: hypothetical protein VM261_20020 [Kofleriaceae bacterium]|nr:hypothetical protein [Kofleriaceae bacterium]